MKDATQTTEENVATATAPLVSQFELNLDAWANLLYAGRYDEDDDVDTESLVWRSLETLSRVSGADGCSIALADWSQELLVFQNGRKVTRQTHSHDTILMQGSLGAQVLKSDGPRVVGDMTHDPQYRFPDWIRQHGFSAAGCFPLGARGRILGVLTLYFRRPRTWTDPEKELLRGMAQSISAAIDNSLLLSESRNNSLSTVQALVRSLEARDSVTSHHSLRVTQYATLLGEQMKLSSRQMRALQYGAMLHDIGKIGISTEILNKKGPLTEAEYEVVRQHPIIGARIVESVDFLREAVPVIRHHHEQYDGKGYPDGLKGEQIPLIARVVCVPDFFDALTSDRPYRAALDPEIAIAEIREGAGTAFDPA
ncbi:MAG: HD domain-containing protein, partial [Gemmatimonadetes bacterium]|nr:HD domain-containing protein [Gemmatimonadota bacterium]